VRIARQDVQIGSWYVLLELADWLADHLPIVWKTVTGQAVDRAPTTEETDVITTLQSYALAVGLPTALLAGVPIAVRPLVSGRRPPGRHRRRRARQAGEGHGAVRPYSGHGGLARLPIPVGGPDGFPTPPFPPADDAYDTAAAEAPVGALVRKIDRALPEEPAARCPSRAWPCSPSSLRGTPGS
jgi:hypothetical protein